MCKLPIISTQYKANLIGIQDRNIKDYQRRTIVWHLSDKVKSLNENRPKLNGWIRKATIMQKWEYTTLTLMSNEKQELEWTDAQDDNRSASERLNELGEDGWELINVAQHAGDQTRTVYWLKRPKD